MSDELMFQLEKIGNEEEYLSVIVMILKQYFDKYPKRDLNSTMILIKKGYKKYLDFLKESE